MSELRGVDNAVDQVMRLRAFREAHPDWKVGFDQGAHAWRALRQSCDTEETVSRLTLCELLDVLHERTS